MVQKSDSVLGMVVDLDLLSVLGQFLYPVYKICILVVLGVMNNSPNIRTSKIAVNTSLTLIYKLIIFLERTMNFKTLIFSGNKSDENQRVI